MSIKSVCVTGASGFIGSHVVRICLEKGLKVRAVVRNSSNESKVAHLKAFNGAADGLEVFDGDIANVDSLQKAFASMDAVIHTATVVKLTSSNPEEDIIKPAIEGTRLALEASEAAGIKRFILTSSIAAVASKGKHSFSEADWTDADRVGSPYPFGKRESELLLDRKPNPWPFSVAAINPGFVQGPILNKVHTQSSPSAVNSMIRGKLPLAPPLYFGCCDVRDVAEAHVAALLDSTFTGRCIVVEGPHKLIEAARIIASKRPALASSVPKREAYVWFLKLMVTFGSKQLTKEAIDSHLEPHTFDATVVTKLLGRKQRSYEESVLDLVDSIEKIFASSK